MVVGFVVQRVLDIDGVQSDGRELAQDVVAQPWIVVACSHGHTSRDVIPCTLEPRVLANHLGRVPFLWIRLEYPPDEILHSLMIKK